MSKKRKRFIVEAGVVTNIPITRVSGDVVPLDGVTTEVHHPKVLKATIANGQLVLQALVSKRKRTVVDVLDQDGNVLATQAFEVVP